MMKKDLEQEIMLIQGDLDEAEATVNELNNEIPRQQDILEQVPEEETQKSAHKHNLKHVKTRYIPCSCDKLISSLS